LPQFFYTRGLFYQLALGKYRSRSDIVYQILLAAKEVDGITKTRILYKSYLSYAQLKEYLKLLIDSELLEHIPERSTYRTTAKGVKIMEAYNAMNTLVGSEVRA
jgi:predicted transcriptional regulator